MDSINQPNRTPELSREQADELRRRQAEQYEALLRQRFKERYPNASLEQKTKIEARSGMLVERYANTPTVDLASRPPIERFENQLKARLSARYPNLTMEQSRRLQERIANAVQRYESGLTNNSIRRPLQKIRANPSRDFDRQEPELYER